VTRSEDLLIAALKLLPEKPADSAPTPQDEENEKGRKRKRRYSELMSQVIAAALAEELRYRGLKEARPGGDGEGAGKQGAERRMSGGIGAKKVDVTWATEESGLLLALSVKCITAKDKKTGNFQKNLINRRGDMLGEAVTLHRRFPYAVLGGFVFFDKGAADDASAQRTSTFHNAHRAFRLFTGRSDPAGRDEQYERLFIALVEASPFQASVKFFLAGAPDEEVSLDHAIDHLLRIVVDRDADFYAVVGPDGKVDPGADASPLSLARMKTSGAIVKGDKAKSKSTKDSTTQPSQLSLDDPLPEEEDEYDESPDD
jgi:hypothetical protein